MSRLMIKPTKWSVRPAKTQFSLGIRQVWSESSLFAWRSIGSWATPECTAKTLIRLGRIPIRLCGCPGWSESSLGAHAILLVLSWDGSNCSTRCRFILLSEAVRLITCECLLQHFFTQSKKGHRSFLQTLSKFCFFTSEQQQKWYYKNL